MPTYTDLDQVKRILRSSSGERVRFSESLKEMTIEDADYADVFNFVFDESEIVYASSSNADIRVVLQFTSSSDFNIFIEREPDKRRRLVGVSDTSSTAVVGNTGISIPAACWTSGTPTSGDRVVLDFDSHISDDDGDSYIEDAEIIVDACLQKMGVTYTSAGSTTLYDSGSVPREVEIATAYLSAYYIFTDIFSDLYQDESNENAYTHRWYDKGEMLLKKFARYTMRSSPSVVALPSYIDKIGDADVGPGYQSQTDDSDVRNLKDTKNDEIFEKETNRYEFNFD